MINPQSEIENPQSTLVLDGEHLTIEQVVAVAYADPGEVNLSLSAEAEAKVARARQAVEQFVAEGRVVYGITTGFGAFKDKLIPPDQARELQRNIIMSHAVGVGAPFPTAVVRAMMLIRANTLAKGYSGIRPEVLRLLLNMIERGVHPIVPAPGFAGRIGDLAPLAHMALVMIGLGEAEFGGKRMPGGEALAQAGLAPVELAAKEGLALTNGTALMAALGCLAVIEAENARGRGRYRRRVEPGGAARHAVGLRRAPPRRSPASPPGGLRRLHAPPAGRLHVRPPGRRPRSAGRIHPALHPAGARRMPRCHQIHALGGRDRAEQRHRQPAHLLGGGAAHRNQRRQLPRRAAGDRVRLPGPGHDRAGQHLGAPAHPAHGWLEQPPRPA